MGKVKTNGLDMRTHSSIEENGVDPDRNASKGTA